MRSSAIGKNTLAEEVEILNISRHGLWLYVNGEEYFLSFEHFPWFKTANISRVLKVKLIHKEHLYWPELDVDLELESIKNPEKYPLISNPKD